MRRTYSKRGAGGVLVLVLFAVFAACVLAVLTMGVRSYSALARRDEDSYRQRSGTQYIAAKLRHADAEGCVSVDSFPDGTACICLRQDIDGEGYITLIYCYDGYLRELFTWEGAHLRPEDGQAVLPAAELDISLENGLLRAGVTDADGRVSRLLMALRSGKGAGA